MIHQKVSLFSPAKHQGVTNNAVIFKLSGVQPHLTFTLCFNDHVFLLVMAGACFDQAIQDFVNNLFEGDIRVVESEKNEVSHCFSKEVYTNLMVRKKMTNLLA